MTDQRSEDSRHPDQRGPGHDVQQEQVDEWAPVEATQPQASEESANAEPAEAPTELTVVQAETDQEPAPEEPMGAEQPTPDEASELVAAEDAIPDDATKVQHRAWPDPTLISAELAPPIELPDEPQAPTDPKTMVDESLYRPDPTPAVSSQATPTEPDDATRELSEEERKLAAERAARRDARQAALAASDTPEPTASEPITVKHRTTDRFWGGLGLFLLRLVVAAIMLVRGLEIVTNLPAAQEAFAKTRLPQPELLAPITGYAALAIAAALIFGLLVRAAGLGIALIAGGALAFVQWGNWSPFVPGRPGFLGELELLLAAVGILFLVIGGGGFGLDRSFRKSRETAKLAREVAKR